jgi:hypothetical protein
MTLNLLVYSRKYQIISQFLQQMFWMQFNIKIIFWKPSKLEFNFKSTIQVQISSFIYIY